MFVSYEKTDKHESKHIILGNKDGIAYVCLHVFLDSE